MDNHPIPQDVTGFQFKLIGNMTVKQFAYVAFGVVFAVLLYYFPLHTPIGAFVKIVFIPILGGSGFAIAFLPIEGRPIDVMVGNFIKALFYPNQFVYQKSGRLFSFASIPSPKATTATPHAASPSGAENKNRQLQAMLGATHVQIQNKLDEREAAFLQTLSSPASSPISFGGPTNTPAMSPLPVATPQLQTVQKTPSPPAHQPEKPTADDLAKQETILAQQLEQAKKEESTGQTPANTSAAHQKASLLEKQIQTIHEQKQQLEKELGELQKQLLGQKTVTPPSVGPASASSSHEALGTNTVQTTQPAGPKAQPTPTAPVKPSETAQPAVKRADLPGVPDTPNVIVGIVKDPRGNVLPNMLVEVKDKDGNPVRAFKTNPLGQFASATPLASGVYTVELEDPKRKNTFQVIQLVADNRILLPIEIVSHDSREELRKQLFN